MNLKLISDFGPEPVTLLEAQAQLNYDGGEKDIYIQSLITAARMLAQIYNGRICTLQRWDLALDHWPNSPITGISAIPNPYFGFWPSDAYRLLAGIRPEVSGIQLLAPLVSVERVTYKDSSGVTTTMAENTDYIVDTFKEPGLICPAPNANWPIVGLWPTSAVHIQFTAGAVPDSAAYSASGAATVTLGLPGAGGYQAGDVLTLTGGIISAQVTLETVDGSGNPETWSVTAPGSGYSVGTSAAATGGTGIGATFTVASLTSVAVTAPEVRRNIKHGISLLVAQWFVNRVPFDAIRFVAEVPFSVSALFGFDKLWV